MGTLGGKGLMVTDPLLPSLFPQWVSPSGFTSLLALTTTNAQGIGTSPLPSWVEAVEEKVLPQDEKEVVDQFIDELYERLEESQYLH